MYVLIFSSKNIVQIQINEKCEIRVNIKNKVTYSQLQDIKP